MWTTPAPHGDPRHGEAVPFVYILRCSDGSLYVGSTWDLERRLAQHDAGEGAAYTRRRRPVTLAWALELPRVDEAYRLEKQVQGWSRAKRQALIDGRMGDLRGLSGSAYRRRADGDGAGRRPRVE